MEYRNKIHLTERKRQTMASTEICAKFFSDKNSVLIVQNDMMRNVLISNNFSFVNNEDALLDRIVYKNSVGYEELLNKYDTWYLDVCSNTFTKEILLLAFDKNKTLIGHYENRKEAEELNKQYGEHRFEEE